MNVKNLKIEYFAALWALIFALLHLAWALGWYIGLDAEAAEKAFQQNWFLAYDLIALALCVAAMLTALALPRDRTHFLTSVIGWACAIVLSLRGAAGLIKLTYLIVIEKDFIYSISFWDLWFCLGAILFLLSVRRFPTKKNGN